jgi:hypothetical protein
MRKTLAKSTEISPGAWVGVARFCNNCLLTKHGFTKGQVARMKAGEFVAVKRKGDRWLVWDINGSNQELPVPGSTIRVFSSFELIVPPRDRSVESLAIFARASIQLEGLSTWSDAI